MIRDYIISAALIIAAVVTSALFFIGLLAAVFGSFYYGIAWLVVPIIILYIFSIVVLGMTET